MCRALQAYRDAAPRLELAERLQIQQACNPHCDGQQRAEDQSSYRRGLIYTLPGLHHLCGQPDGAASRSFDPDSI